MNYSLTLHNRSVLSGVIVSLILAGMPAVSLSQEKKAKSKPSAAAKTQAKPPGAATQYDKHLAANMKLLQVLRRYAECLSTATDATTATLAANQIEEITLAAITAGEEVVKLGHPAPELEAKLGKDADLQLTAQLVAEKTKAAVKAISENGEVKTVLAPAIENFQAALNRIQQAADDPKGPADSPDKKAEATAAGGSTAAPDAGSLPAKPDDTAAAPPPPAPPQ